MDEKAKASSFQAGWNARGTGYFFYRDRNGHFLIGTVNGSITRYNSSKRIQYSGRFRANV